MLSKLEWIFLKHAAMGTPAEAMVSPLDNTYLSPSELLMREALQNSADERRKDIDKPVRFEVERYQLVGDQKKQVIKLFELQGIKKRSEHFFNKAHGWYQAGLDTLRHLEDDQYPLPILAISDFNTHGLGGEWNSPRGLENRFHKLVLSLFNSDKVNEGEDLLGSYGVGKMVYARASNLRMMAYYSVFEPTESSNQEHARFMGSAFFPSHTFEGQDFTGVSFLGLKNEDSSYPAKPLVNDDAHAAIESIGLRRRDQCETGTTVILLDAATSSINECQQAVEMYWWPRLIDRSDKDYVEVKFKNQNEAVSTPQLTQNKKIQPFIECYQALKTGKSLDGYHFFSRVPKNKKSGGALSIKGSPADPSKSNLVNKIALIRRGLVIEYSGEFAKEQGAPIVGVFEVGKESIKEFTYSEPHAHDEFNPNLPRLKTALGAEAVKLVAGVLGKIKSHVRDTQTRLEDTSIPERTNDIDFFDDILGKVFKPRRQRPKPPLQMERAISIYKSTNSERRGNYVVHSIEVDIALVDKAEFDSVPAELKIDLKPLESAEGKLGAPVPRKIFSADGKLAAEADVGQIEVTLTKANRLKLTASAQCHPAWEVQWSVKVEGRPGAGEKVVS